MHMNQLLCNAYWSLFIRYVFSGRAGGRVVIKWEMSIFLLGK